MNYLLDTNILNAFLKDWTTPQQKRIQQKLDEIDREARTVFISTINYYEIKRGLLAANATRKMEVFNEFCQDYPMLGVDSRQVLDKASAIYADLKKRGELIEDADIFIAAIALIHDVTLVTDDSHFDRIDGLSPENWLLLEKEVDNGNKSEL